MKIDLKDIEKIKQFMLSDTTDEEAIQCYECIKHNYELECEIKHICDRYSSSESILIEDLFDTIEDLINQLNKLKIK